MLWSPVVRNQELGAKHNRMKDVAAIADALKSEFGVEIEMVINRRFQEALEALRRVARVPPKNSILPLCDIFKSKNVYRPTFSQQAW